MKAGDYNLADKEKCLIEEKQRKDIKEREKRGLPCKSQFGFKVQDFEVEDFSPV
jgi:hypothetical protein